MIDLETIARDERDITVLETALRIAAEQFDADAENWRQHGSNLEPAARAAAIAAAFEDNAKRSRDMLERVQDAE